MQLGPPLAGGGLRKRWPLLVLRLALRITLASQIVINFALFIV